MELKILKNKKAFFDLLPLEWQESILPIWNTCEEQAQILTLEQDHEICAGGMVFHKPIPEMEAYREEADFWFFKNYRYIGYVWVPESKRNNNYGSLWLKELLLRDPNQAYWLTTEDKQLRYFYEKAGFTYVKYISCNGVEEELFVYRNES
jgi:hypothetical protein